MKVQGMSARTPEHRIKTHPVQTATMIAIAGSVSLAVAMGVGRFAFTPILPMMLHDRVLGLDFASNLATANYLGYLAGAMLCMGLPKIWSQVKVMVETAWRPQAAQGGVFVCVFPRGFEGNSPCRAGALSRF